MKLYKVTLRRKVSEDKMYAVRADNKESAHQRALRLDRGETELNEDDGEEEGEWETSSVPRNRVVKVELDG